MTLLSVKNLTVEFPTPDGLVQAVHDTSFSVSAGETLAIVGESGSGKTVTNLALMGLIPKRTANITGSAIFETKDGPVDLISIDRNELRKYRGKDIAMIFQDPLASLDPRMNIGEIIAEPLRTHYPKTPEADVKLRVSDVMNKVGLLDNLVNRYPHEFVDPQVEPPKS